MNKKGRPTKYSCAGKVISFYLTTETIAKLTQLSNRKMVTKSQMINLLVISEYQNSVVKEDKKDPNLSFLIGDKGGTK